MVVLEEKGTWSTSTTTILVPIAEVAGGLKWIMIVLKSSEDMKSTGGGGPSKNFMSSSCSWRIGTVSSACHEAEAEASLERRSLEELEVGRSKEASRIICIACVLISCGPLDWRHHHRWPFHPNPKFKVSDVGATQNSPPLSSFLHACYHSFIAFCMQDVDCRLPMQEMQQTSAPCLPSTSMHPLFPIWNDGEHQVVMIRSPSSALPPSPMSRWWMQLQPWNTKTTI